MATLPAAHRLDDLSERVQFRAHFPHSLKRADEQRYDYLACPRCDSGDKRHLAVFDNGLHCFKSGCRWTPYQWLTEIEGQLPRDAFRVLEALAIGDDLPLTPRRRDAVPALVPDVIDRFATLATANHRALTAADRVWWHGRGVSDAAIDRFQLGARGGWYTIPCADSEGAIFAVKQRWGDDRPPPGMKRYCALPGSAHRHAPWLLAGTARNVCIIVAGEIKALALWSAITAAGLDWAVATPTGGERNWAHHWAALFNGYPRLALWPDRDAAGATLVTNVHTHNLGRATLIVPADHEECKAVDDYLAAGGDALALIADRLKISRKELPCPSSISPTPLFSTAIPTFSAWGNGCAASSSRSAGMKSL